MFHPVSLEWAQVCRPLAGEYHHSFFKCSLLQDTVVVFRSREHLKKVPWWLKPPRHRKLHLPPAHPLGVVPLLLLLHNLAHLLLHLCILHNHIRPRLRMCPTVENMFWTHWQQFIQKGPGGGGGCQYNVVNHLPWNWLAAKEPATILLQPQSLRILSAEKRFAENLNWS